MAGVRMAPVVDDSEIDRIVTAAVDYLVLMVPCVLFALVLLVSTFTRPADRVGCFAQSPAHGHGQVVRVACPVYVEPPHCVAARVARHYEEGCHR